MTDREPAPLSAATHVDVRAVAAWADSPGTLRLAESCEAPVW
jgi:hypothetical protein